jgi:2-iminoacetate synthase ThiH
MDEQQIEALIERAAKRGAKEALESIGLHDDNAIKDVYELRGLLEAWRGAKKTVWKTITQALTMALLGALAAGTFIQLKK